MEDNFMSSLDNAVSMCWEFWNNHMTDKDKSRYKDFHDYLYCMLSMSAV